MSKRIHHIFTVYIYKHHFLITTINSNSSFLNSHLFQILLQELFVYFTSAKEDSLYTKMAIRQILKRSLSNERRSYEVPKRHLAVYVGENEMKRFVIPLSYLNHPLFQELLCQAEEEFGYRHPMGGLTIPCSEDLFVDVTSRLSRA
ncbi:hypothetical protein ABFS83_06G128900 [Erythranthe nasuta]